MTPLNIPCLMQKGVAPIMNPVCNPHAHSFYSCFYFQNSETKEINADVLLIAESTGNTGQSEFNAFTERNVFQSPHLQGILEDAGACEDFVGKRQVFEKAYHVSRLHSQYTFEFKIGGINPNKTLELDSKIGQWLGEFNSESNPNLIVSYVVGSLFVGFVCFVIHKIYNRMHSHSFHKKKEELLRMYEQNGMEANAHNFPFDPTLAPVKGKLKIADIIRARELVNDPNYQVLLSYPFVNNEPKAFFARVHLGYYQSNPTVVRDNIKYLTQHAREHHIDPRDLINSFSVHWQVTVGPLTVTSETVQCGALHSNKALLQLFFVLLLKNTKQISGANPIYLMDTRFMSGIDEAMSGVLSQHELYLNNFLDLFLTKKRCFRAEPFIANLQTYGILPSEGQAQVNTNLNLTKNEALAYLRRMNGAEIHFIQLHLCPNHFGGITFGTRKEKTKQNLQELIEIFEKKLSTYLRRMRAINRDLNVTQLKDACEAYLLDLKKIVHGKGPCKTVPCSFIGAIVYEVFKLPFRTMVPLANMMTEIMRYIGVNTNVFSMSIQTLATSSFDWRPYHEFLDGEQVFATDMILEFLGTVLLENVPSKACKSNKDRGTGKQIISACYAAICNKRQSFYIDLLNFKLLEDEIELIQDVLMSNFYAKITYSNNLVPGSKTLDGIHDMIDHAFPKKDAEIMRFNFQGYAQDKKFIPKHPLRAEEAMV